MCSLADLGRSTSASPTTSRGGWPSIGDHEVVFTSKYRIGRLVHLEEYQFVDEAIRRESQLKSWRRSRKVALIEAQNPDWRDLADERSGQD
jgi:hypothetical protein